ncbi:EAL domain, c-di-GMP-specific phosphodiesterase class I (or its enzymatically inactive variant) [Ruminococcaceae bacterium FB2012]|nr:EAL domain, c-di-GMP-specific phosphodiesterase class I (or its enzymatically inactive variant) [Ruminococcaceae bacterium FB2012]
MGRKRAIRRLARFAAFLTLLAAWTFAALPVSAEDPSGELTVGVPADRCPVFYMDEDTGEVIGIGTDLMRIAAEKAGFSVTFQPIGEETVKEALDNSFYDFVMPLGSAVASSYGEATVVSDNLFQTPFTLVALSGQKLPPLENLRVGMLRSLAGGAETVKQLYPGVNITLFESMDESVKALRDDKVDALLHNSYVWSYVLQKPSYSDLSVQPSAMFSMDFRAGTLDTPQGREKIRRLNEGIAALTDTQRQAIILDYTSRRLYHSTFSDFLYERWPFMVLGALLLISFAVILYQKQRAFKFKQEEKLRQLIDHDPLTGVLSLSGFRKRAEELLRLHPNMPYVISYSNIRNFKYINDRFGMEAGNELLRFWAEKTGAILTDLDALGRIEADHFAVLRHVENEEQIHADTRLVFDPVRNFFISRSKEMRVQICTGVYSLTTADFKDISIDRFLDYARVAEKRLRETHNEGFVFYNEKQWDLGKLVVDVTGRLPLAMKTGEIQVWYQPQVDHRTGEIIGAEALCRWDHAERGMMAPSKFITALEEAGLIYDLDCYVWERACKDLRRWELAGKPQTVSVNLSRADFAKDADLPGHFRDLIQRYKLSPDRLHIEITETAYVENPELLIVTTKKFREYGFRVEMDDFGSGYSSLNMLKEVQVDRIKLDLHFLTETGDAEKGQIIVRHMILMAQSLGMELIAEGVERKEQAEMLSGLGCTEMQGFYYYKPMPAADFELLRGIF